MIRLHRRHRSEFDDTHVVHDSVSAPTSLNFPSRKSLSSRPHSKPSSTSQNSTHTQFFDQTSGSMSTLNKTPHTLCSPTVTTSTISSSSATTSVSGQIPSRVTSSPSSNNACHPHKPSLRALATPTTPNSQASDPSSTDGSRSIPYADVQTLARLLSSHHRDDDDDIQQPHTIAFPPTRCKPFSSESLSSSSPSTAGLPFSHTSRVRTDLLSASDTLFRTSAVPTESVISDTSCPDVLFRPISPVDGRNQGRQNNPNASERTVRTVARPVPIPACKPLSPPSPSSSPPPSFKSQPGMFPSLGPSPISTQPTARDERVPPDPLFGAPRWNHPRPAHGSSGKPSSNKSNLQFPGMFRVTPKRAFTTLSGSRPASSVDSFASSCNSTSNQSNSNSSFRSKACLRQMRHSGRCANDNSSSASVCTTGRRISWHRAQAFGCDVDPANPLDGLEPCVRRLDSTASDSTPLLMHLPSRRHRSDGLGSGTKAFPRDGARAASNHTTDSAVNSRVVGNNADGPFHASRVPTSGRDVRPEPRRGSSYLTMGFLRRKGSMDCELDNGISDGRSSANLNANTGADLFDNLLIRRVHGYASLSAFGQGEPSDGIVLYTNSVRAEINDLIFLCSVVQRCYCLSGNDIEEEIDFGHRKVSVISEIRKKHRNIDLDFELWFSRFAQYCGLILFGMEEYAMRYITEVLAQRDVMLSRTTADVEAEGVSHVQAWSRVSKRLFERMDEVRCLLSDVENRVMWLRRNRQFQDDLGRPDVWMETLKAVRRLIPGLVSLLDDLDEHVSNVLSLRMDFRRGMKQLHRQFATLLTKEGSPPLGWSALITLTRWIADRKLRNDHVKAMSRAARLSLFSRYRADNSHHTIVRVHQTIAAEEGRCRFGLL